MSVINLPDTFILYININNVLSELRRRIRQKPKATYRSNKEIKMTEFDVFRKLLQEKESKWMQITVDK